MLPTSTGNRHNNIVLLQCFKKMLVDCYLYDVRNEKKGIITDNRFSQVCLFYVLWGHGAKYAMEKCNTV